MEPEQQSQQQQNEEVGTGKSSFLCRQSSTRWTPTTDQIRILKDLYYNNGVRSPSAEQIQRISAKLRQYGKIEGKNVFYWFQNHKARERQKKRFTAHDLPMQRNVWKLEDNTVHNKFTNISPGYPSSSASHGVLAVGSMVPNYGYGSVAVEKSFRDCSISPCGVVNNSGPTPQNFAWVGVDPYTQAWTRKYVYETLDEEPEDQDVPQKQTLPLFPMHGEDVPGFCSTYKQQNSASYFNGWSFSENEMNGSLELTLNSYAAGSMNCP